MRGVRGVDRRGEAWRHEKNGAWTGRKGIDLKGEIEGKGGVG